MSLFVCPICGGGAGTGAGALPLPRRATAIDVAREGYTHLLPANRKHSKMPGDDKGMAAARSVFLSKDYYARPAGRPVPSGTGLRPGSIRRCWTPAAARDTTPARVYRALRDAGKAPGMAGMDISKAILRRAAKREKDVEFAVASSYHLPVADRSDRPAAQLLLPAGAGGVPAGAPARRALSLCGTVGEAPVGAEAGAL